MKFNTNNVVTLFIYLFFLILQRREVKRFFSQIPEQEDMLAEQLLKDAKASKCLESITIEVPREGGAEGYLYYDMVRNYMEKVFKSIEST